MNISPRTVSPKERADVSAGVRRWAIKGAVGVLTAALLLFLPAWRLDWPMGWAVVALYGLWHGALALLLIPRSPELLAERGAGPQEGAKRWDTAVLGVVGLTTIAKYVIAGFDLRLGWTSQLWRPVAPVIQVAALVVAAMGFALTTWAMVANAFFSEVVRIQDDRGHTVATGGPYRYARHPGYVGQIAFELAVSVALGSLWALIPGVLSALLIILRTALEDRTLQEELAGYQEYAGRVRYRLLPGVW